MTETHLANAAPQTSVLRKHGLENLLGKFPSADNEVALQLIIHSDRNYLNLRGKPDRKAFVAAVEQHAGLTLPLTPNRFTAMEQGELQRIYWLGPDEWLIGTTAKSSQRIETELREALADVHSSIVDVSGGNICLTLKGEHTRHVLAKGCTLDLHDSQFKPGRCAQTGLAKANVLLAAVDEDVIDIIVRRSFAEYLLLWLERSGKEFGIRFNNQSAAS